MNLKQRIPSNFKETAGAVLWLLGLLFLCWIAHHAERKLVASMVFVLYMAVTFSILHYRPYKIYKKKNL